MTGTPVVFAVDDDPSGGDSFRPDDFPFSFDAGPILGCTWAPPRHFGRHDQLPSHTRSSCKAQCSPSEILQVRRRGPSTVRVISQFSHIAAAIPNINEVFWR